MSAVMLGIKTREVLTEDRVMNMQKAPPCETMGEPCSDRHAQYNVDIYLDTLLVPSDPRQLHFEVAGRTTCSAACHFLSFRSTGLRNRWDIFTTIAEY